MKYVAFVSGISLSAVAAFYSVLGLTSIFAGAFWAVVVMGATLEVSKVVATSWLFRNWSKASKWLRNYLMGAVIVLSLITSLGIFGFLSKAHSNQTMLTSDQYGQILILDEQILIAKDDIERTKKALRQLDVNVEQLQTKGPEFADQANKLQLSQRRQQTGLVNNLKQSQSSLIDLQKQRALLKSDVKGIEAEVGPIKYIASFIYGETSQDVLEKSVTWLIIIIIFVFDPMALALIMISNMKTTKTYYKRKTGIINKVKKTIAKKKNVVEVGKNSIMRM
jgi:hypothetical protein